MAHGRVLLIMGNSLLLHSIYKSFFSFIHVTFYVSGIVKLGKWFLKTGSINVINGISIAGIKAVTFSSGNLALNNNKTLRKHAHVIYRDF